jgi:hypothetical protein
MCFSESVFSWKELKIFVSVLGFSCDTLAVHCRRLITELCLVYLKNKTFQIKHRMFLLINL